MSLRPERDMMNIGLYGLMIVFGAFILLLIFNPNLSCFGKRVKSPLYPVLRRRSRNSRKKIKIQDYGLDLGGKQLRNNEESNQKEKGRKDLKTQDYGFDLGRRGSGNHQHPESEEGKTDSHQDEPSNPSGE
jgi:hypothetical protein